MTPQVKASVLYVQAWRERAELSQAELARRSHVPQPTISRMEAGTSAVSLTNLVRLANALHIEVADLFRAPGRPVSTGIRRMGK